MFLNVIIPSYRASATILTTINAVLSSTPFEGRFDVTVVDSSDDNTADVVFAAFPTVRIVRLPARAFPGAARNRGVEATEGDVLCFVDADARPHPDWLRNIHVFLTEHPDIAAVGGPVLNDNPGEGWSRLAHWCEFSGYGLGAPEGPRRVVPAANVAIRREAFMHFGPFLEDQFGNEDVLLFHRMRVSGAVLFFSRSVIVYHRNKTTLPGIYRHQRLLGESTGRARVLFDLPGNFLTRPGASAVIPLAKTALVKLRLLTQEPADFPSFLLHWPKVLKAMTEFARGFREGVRTARTELGEKNHG